MKNLFLLFCLFISISCKQDVSELVINNAVVQDYSDLFSITEEQKLSEKIINYKKRTTNEICIYTIDTVPNNKTVLNYASYLANNLGVGLKSKDNGLLILISRLDRKMAIATGYGTEKTITDKIAFTIIEKTMTPKFKDKLYYEGLNMALDSIFIKW